MAGGDAANTTETSDKVLPLTLHTAGVVLARLTASPELAVATKAGGTVPRAWLAGVTKVINCGASATVKVWDIVAAAAKKPLPAWLASTVQLPAVCKFSVVPTTVHTAGVLEASNTVKPEVALATKGPGATPSVWLPGDTKLMPCGAAAMLKVRTTAGAAA